VVQGKTIKAEHGMIIYTDGASKGNPGPAGAGVYILETGKILRKFLGIATNNEAEYQALIIALKYAIRKKKYKVQVRSDSLLLVKQVNGDWATHSVELAILRTKVWELLEKKILVFTLLWIPREQNKEADRAANEAIDGYTKS
jgi:ribonuclease HI